MNDIKLCYDMAVFKTDMLYPTLEINCKLLLTTTVLTISK